MSAVLPWLGIFNVSSDNSKFPPWVGDEQWGGNGDRLKFRGNCWRLQSYDVKQLLYIAATTDLPNQAQNCVIKFLRVVGASAKQGLLIFTRPSLPGEGVPLFSTLGLFSPFVYFPSASLSAEQHRSLPAGGTREQTDLLSHASVITSLPRCSASRGFVGENSVGTLCIFPLPGVGGVK